MNRRVLEHLLPNCPDFQCENARLMVIDDDPIITRFVALCLRNAGFENVVCLNHSTAALEQIARLKPDLILLDIEMPHLSGLELLELLRRDEQYRDISIVMLSGSDKASKYRSLNLGAVDFINKPVDAEQLERHVRKALRVI